MMSEIRRRELASPISFSSFAVPTRRAQSFRQCAANSKRTRPRTYRQHFRPCCTSLGTPSSDDSKANETDKTVLMVSLCSAAALLNYADRVNMSVCVVPLGDALGYGIGERATALSAFFWGYVPAQLLSAIAARRLGAKKVLAFGATGWSLFTALTPMAAFHGLPALAACRAAMGACEGCAFPAVHQVFAERVPAARRASAIAALGTGKALGTTVALLVAPAIVRNMGWEVVFQVFGAAGALWVAAWWAFAEDAPRSDLSTRSIQGEGDDDKVAVDVRRKSLGEEERAAFWCIVRIRACYAQVATQFLAASFHYTVLSWLPTYLGAVHGVVVGDAWFAFVPYAAAAVAAPFGGVLSDALARRGNVARARKMTTALSCGATAVLMVAFSQARSVEEAVFYIACCLAAFALNAGGFEAAYLDMAEPQYVALFKGVSNTVGAASGAVAIKAVASLLAWSGDWRVVFVAQAAWVTAAAIVYATFGADAAVITEKRIQDMKKR